MASAVDSAAVASLSMMISPSGKYLGRMMALRMVPHASVRVMCRLRHSPSSGKRQKSPAAVPHMKGLSTSEHASLPHRGAKTMPSSKSAVRAPEPSRAASSTPLQKLAAHLVCRSLSGRR